MRFLSLDEILDLHRMVLVKTGGAPGIHNLGALESAIAQPHMTFGGAELYTTLVVKAAALAYSLIQNHPFIDGNKRVGHAAMETFLVLNGQEISASTEEQESIILGVASSCIGREEFTEWVRAHLTKRSQVCFKGSTAP